MKKRDKYGQFEPSRMSDFVLRLLLGRRRWESVSGDLVEECREVILPAEGSLQAHIWYRNQILSFATPFHFGTLLGIVSVILVVIFNVIFPLLHWEITTDSLSEKLCSRFCFGSSLFLWAAVGGVVRRRHQRLKAALVGGAVTALMQIGLLMIAFVVVNNLFLDIVSLQPEKIWGFQHSGEPNMRAYVNAAAVKGVLFALPTFVVLGAICGTIGGAVASWSSPSC